MLAIAITWLELQTALCNQACQDMPRKEYNKGLFFAPDDCFCGRRFSQAEITHQKKKLKLPVKIGEPTPERTIDARDYMPTPSVTWEIESSL